MDRADLELAVLEQLRHAQALRTGEGEIHAPGDAALEQRQVLGRLMAGDEQMQIVHLRRVDLSERARQEVRLLLVVALERDAIAGAQQPLECRYDLGTPHQLAVEMRGNASQPALLVVAAAGPRAATGLCGCLGHRPAPA